MVRWCARWLHWAAHNNNVSRGTGLASNEVHILNRKISEVANDYILEGRGVRGHQGLIQDQLEYLELVRDNRHIKDTK